MTTSHRHPADSSWWRCAIGSTRSPEQLEAHFRRAEGSSIFTDATAAVRIKARSCSEGKKPLELG